MIWVCCYTVVKYKSNGNIEEIYSDCFTRRAISKEQAEADTRAVAVKMNPGMRVFIVICKKL